MTDRERNLEFRDLISHGLLGVDENISREDFDKIIDGCVELSKRQSERESHKAKVESPGRPVRHVSDNQILSYQYRKGVKEVFPAHPNVRNWLFTEDTEEEAALAHFMAVVGAKNGITANDLMHLFPAVLRMLKNDSEWAK